MIGTTQQLSPRPGPIAVIALGVFVVLGAVLADALGLSGGGDGFGWKQLIALILGLMVLLTGAAWLLRPVLDDVAPPLEEE